MDNPEYQLAKITMPVRVDIADKAAPSPPRIREEKCAPYMQAYLAALIHANPSFRRQFSASPQSIAQSLDKNWPALQGYGGEKRELLALIQTLLGRLPVPDLVIHVTFAYREIIQPILPEGGEAAIAASFDADNGAIKSLHLHNRGQPGPLHELTIANGIILIAQSFIEAQSFPWDDKYVLSGQRAQGAMLQSATANLDSLQGAIWEIHATGADSGYAQIPVLLLGRGQFMQRAAMENISANFLRDALIGTNRFLDLYDSYFDEIKSEHASRPPSRVTRASSLKNDPTIAPGPGDG